MSAAPASHTMSVLDVLRRQPVVSRAELSEMTGLSAATISRIVGKLRNDGVVSERSLSTNGVGRPPRVVQLRADAALVLGIDAGGSRIRATLTDLGGEVQARATRTVRSTRRASSIVAAIRGLASEVGTQVPGEIVSAAAGISGIVDEADGRVLLSPDLPGLNGVAVATMLQDTLEVPVAIDNDDLLAAIGEASFGAAKGCTDVVFLSLGFGLGAGLIVGGHPVRGARSAAGAIAYLAPGRLEDRASGRSIPTRYEEHRGIRRSSSKEPLTAERVFQLASDGDDVAREVVTDAFDALGDLVVDVAGLLDPEVIVVGGGLVRGQPALLPSLASRLEVLPYPPRLMASDLGEDAVARGASGLALELARRRLAGIPTDKVLVPSSLQLA